MIFHVLNRGVGKRKLFHKPQDYDAFERVIDLVWERIPVRIMAYCLMHNHWHLVLWPEADGQLSEFMRLLTVTHAQRHHAHRHSAGEGPIYQGRFKSFPIQEDRHLLIAARYVERNAVRAGLARRAADWTWCSAFRRARSVKTRWLLPLRQWPVHPPNDWSSWVDQPQTEQELAALHHSIERGAPLGDAAWQTRIAGQLHLQSTLRPRGRPRVRQTEGVAAIKDSRPL